nr:T9SS type A sorting domain-containing protein [Bacteroidota bacterium]
MIVDSTGTIMIDNLERKIQYINCGDGMMIEFGHHVIEGIGNTSFMFPTLDGSINGPLRCYQDTLVELFVNPFRPINGWNFQDCEEILSDIAELEFTNNYLVYPNPASERVFINNIKRTTEFWIFDVYGNRIKHGFIEPSNEIWINDLGVGCYFLELRLDDFFISRKIIRK